VTVKKIFQCFIGMLWYGFASIAVFAAVFLTLARLLLPLVEDYRVEAEQTLSEYVGQTVRVENLKAQWAGFEPQLHFSNVRLYDKNNEQVLFKFKDARMGIDLFSSISNRDFVPSSFTISGIALSITRHADEHFSIDGLLDKEQDSSQEYSQLLFEWLLRQPDIGIESSSIVWTDIPLNEKNLFFKDVNIRLRNYADVHQFDGDVKLPARLGEKIMIAAELQGSPKNMSEWHGDIYAKAKKVVIPAWWRKPIFEGISLAAGRSDFELWGKWRNKSLYELEGTLSLSDLTFRGTHAAAIKFNGLSTVLSWHRSNTEVSLQLDNLIPMTPQGAWPVSQLSLISDNVTQRLAVVASYANLSDVLPIVDALQALDIDSANKLRQIQPSAKLKNISLVLSMDESVEQWYIDSQFSDLTTQAWDGVPGLAGLSGNFVIENNNGSVQLESKQVTVDAIGLFRESIDVAQLTGTLAWQSNESGLSIEASNIDVSNADISLRARMNLLIPSDASPIIDFLADFERGNGSKAYKYLPIAVLGEKTIAWLDKSIINGEVTTGKVILRGPLDKFPFDHGEGKFETRFNVIDAKLDYEPGWPAISEMRGEVVFHGRALDITGYSGRILDANVHDVVAHIADIELDDPLLALRGEVESSTQDIIEYVVSANLAEDYGQELRLLKSTGDASLKLEINIPMTSGDGHVSGEAVLKDVNLGVTDKNIELRNINGKVLVNNDGLQGKDIRGELFNKAVNIELSHDDDASTALSIKAKGRFDLNKLLKEEFNKHIPVISLGETEWLANLYFRNLQGDRHPAVLELESDLKDVSVNLPAPFGKEASAIKPLKLISQIKNDDGIQLEVDFGDDVGSIIRLKDSGKGFEYAGLSVAFGNELPVPPENKRLSIVGQLDALSVDEWAAYVDKSEWTGDAESLNDFLPWLEEVNLEVAALSALGSNFNLQRLRLGREDERWHVAINADRIKGEIHIPYDMSADSVKASLAFLKLDRIESDTEPTYFDPRKLPALALSIDQLIFDGAKLGTLNMAATKTANGLTMNKLVIDGPDTRLTANGGWNVENDEQITRLTAKLKTKRFNALLTELGYSAGFETSKSRHTAQLEWPGNPMQFSVGALNGSMQIKMNKGQLFDISPGAGRIFGLLSLQALPRRLTLDFSDLFKKGFSFDEIKGKFFIEQGDAYTTDLYLDGPSARIDVSGRTGLTSRDYDQLITVTPDLTGSLPLAGALLGGPIAGGVVFALDKLLRPAIDDITRYQYTVTGAWDDPQVERLENVVLDAEVRVAK